MEVVAIIGLCDGCLSRRPSAWLQNDIKKVFAYSTVSQLGYMFSASECGAFSAGIYHLMTHAFFKALLFLGAGSVIHALRRRAGYAANGRPAQQDPDHVLDYVCAALAIAGIPPFSGFFSKDAILVAAYHHAPWMYWVGVITAGMTAFYVFRAMFMTFFGEYRGDTRIRTNRRSRCGAARVLRLLSLPAASCSRSRVFLERLFPPLKKRETSRSWLISVACGRDRHRPRVLSCT